jgi:hypothetical protein
MIQGQQRKNRRKTEGFKPGRWHGQMRRKYLCPAADEGIKKM